MVASIAVALLMSLATAPASGVVNGQPDTEHTYVGTLVLQWEDGSYHYWCSGTMVTDRVFVSAGHCMVPEVREGSYPGSEIVGLTLDPVVTSDVTPTIHPGTAVPMPGWPGRNWTRDVGVFILEAPIAALAAIALPVLPEVGQVATWI